MSEIQLDLTFEDIITTKRIHLRKIVKIKVNKSAMKYLLSKIKSKDKEIQYKPNLECQAYLKPNNILTLQEQREFFFFLS